MYKLELTDAQLQVVKVALEEYFRIEYNQWGDVADRLAKIGADFSRENPNHKEIFNAYIARKDHIQTVLEAAGRITMPRYNAYPKSECALIAQDIWATIRHQLWKDSVNKNLSSVDASPVFQVGSEPLPNCERIDVTEVSK